MIALFFIPCNKNTLQSFVLLMIKRTTNWFVSCCLIAFIICITSCNKDVFYTKNDAKLNFSTSIVTFDTIFTSVNSITRTLKVFNPYNATIQTNISLVGGDNSYYSINVDGKSGKTFKNVEIAAKDSIFIFIRTNIPPNGANVPMLVSDTLAFFTNGNQQKVELLAFGQDAHFIVPNGTYAGISGNIIAHEGETVYWINDKPYVIYGYAIIDSTAKLIVEAGTKIYLHKSAGIWAYIGSCLEVNGTKENPVVFQGDRTENWYQKDYAQWDRIWLNESQQNHVFNYAIITNAFIGIQAETLNESYGNKLQISNTIIQKNELYGLFSRGYNIQMENCVLTESKEMCLYVAGGGNQEYYHNTIYNHYSVQRGTPAAYFCNYYELSVNGSIITYYGDLDVQNTNNIFYGSNTNELRTASLDQGICDIKFDNCLIKINDSLYNLLDQRNCLHNINPNFTNYSEFDFSLSQYSPCKRAGIYLPSVNCDILGQARNNPPSIGAYE